jgi:hypothetical protein
VDKLKSLAESVDPCLVEMVAKEAPWNPVSKATLIESGPQVTADLLNAAGIGAERADLVAFVMASWCIYSGRAVIADKLEKMAREKAERAQAAKVPGPRSKVQVAESREEDDGN